MPCIFESSLSKIEQAIKDISAAMATGTLYSRDKMLLAQTTPSGEFETKLYQAVLEKIRSDIHVLQRIITELIEHIEDAEGKVDWRTGADGLDTPYCMDHLLYHMVEKGVSRQFVSRAFRFMDDVDECRNSILSKVNKLLELSGTRKLPLITKSSVQLEKSEKIEITEISEPHPYGNYYLTFARPLRAFLNNEPGYLLTKNLNLPDFIDKTLYDYLGIITISDLVKFSRQELLACNEIGIQQLNEIEKALADFGFSLS
jgi:hypothetical protein